jgi:hypothetical protein
MGKKPEKFKVTAFDLLLQGISKINARKERKTEPRTRSSVNEQKIL